MALSRREFLKSSVIAAGEVALPSAAAAAIVAKTPGESGIAASETLPSAAQHDPLFTRGVGIYPGDHTDNFGPTLLPADGTYRNLALRRPAKHSSSYDYNLTAQLVTDGIKDEHLPVWVAVSTSKDGTLPKQDREIILDHFPPIGLKMEGSKASIEVQIAGGAAAPSVDRVAVFVAMSEEVSAKGLSFTVSTSEDGRVWEVLAEAANPVALSPAGYPPDLVRNTNLFFPSMPLKRISTSRFYRVNCEIAEGHHVGPMLQWMIGQVEFYHGKERVNIGGPYGFTSAWMSAGSAEEWVSVDLGARCEFDQVTLFWIARAAAGSIQISDDEKHWTNIEKLDGRTGQIDTIRFAKPARARYVRVLMTRPATQYGYILSELEVHGRGGLKPVPALAPAIGKDGSLDLSGGSWKVERSSVVSVGGNALSMSGFDDVAWVVATVPGTVLASFYNAEAVVDPNFGENQLYISDSYFCSDFWYRTEFEALPISADEIAWLNFDGVNWKAEIYLNGISLGRIDGGFMRGRFDVTTKLAPGKRNALAVRIEKNATPGSTKQKTYEVPGRNGGALGADNPTYHASIGWDWIPTIRGRNIGIWGSVSLDRTAAVTLENPFVSSVLPLPDTSSAQVHVEVDLVNHRAETMTGTLRARFGSIEVTQPFHAAGSSTAKLTFEPKHYPELTIQHPQLWWPTGYGDPHLYDVELSLETADGAIVQKKQFKAGIRQMTYSEEGGKLTMYVNGRRFICRGGNWGFSESMLRYRSREYDAAVRYHREMNFTMVRNWVGQIGDEAFYEACDKYGVMIWQDFWLANPWDGPNPDDDLIFMSNVRDLLLRIRNHPSLGLYCGRNEGYPPKPLEDGIRTALKELHPGLHYIPSSADDVVSGHGPYHALQPAEYFRIADEKLHSEIGMPNIPTLESVRLMMPEEDIWPQGLDWGLHDFCLLGAQGGLSFLSIIDESYGGANNAEQWISLAQFVNYEGYRAMFESQSIHRAGLLLWMSHPCWPSFVWQTYDYYLEPTAAYFGCRKASEPIHIQWNRDAETIEVVNYSAGDVAGVSASVEILNMDGRRMSLNSTSLDSKEDSVQTVLTMKYPSTLSPVHFLRLSLTQGGRTLSSNDYMRGVEEGNYRAIRQLANAHVHAVTTLTDQGDTWELSTTLQNTSAWPALMTRLKVVRDVTGDRILPAIYSDNYLTLMPGEQRVIRTEVRHADTRGERPKMVVTGFNVK